MIQEKKSTADQLYKERRFSEASAAYLDGLMGFAALKSVPVAGGGSTSNLSLNPIVKKFKSVLTLNTSMCHLEMGFPQKALDIVCSLIKDEESSKSTENLWNCYFKQGVILDRMGEPEKSL